MTDAAAAADEDTHTAHNVGKAAPPEVPLRKLITTLLAISFGTILECECACGQQLIAHACLQALTHCLCTHCCCDSSAGFDYSVRVLCVCSGGARVLSACRLTAAENHLSLCSLKMLTGNTLFACALQIYTQLSKLLSKVFFPSNDPALQALSFWGVYAGR